MEVYLSKLAESKLKKLSDYLLEEWSQNVKSEFLAKFTAKITQIESQPESCPKSKELGGIYKCVVTKQTTFYYRILADKKEIEIITLFDTRQDPDKLKGQLE
jgi:plasmid stabilization system protein ParE